MKKFTFLLFTAFFLTIIPRSNAQRSAIGFYGTATEYIGDLNLVNNKNSYELYKFKFFKPGGAISVQQYLNPSFNLVEMLSYNRLQYQKSAELTGVDADFLVFNLMLKYKFNNGYFLKEDAAVSPFLIGGLGATRINSRQLLAGGVEGATISNRQTKANLALGAGVFFRFNDAFGIEASSIFERPFDDAWDGVVRGGNDTYLQHNLGLVFSLKKPVDSDKDGVPDKKDKCPHTPRGVKVDLKGCPLDSDGDGVPDNIDKCPQQPGSPELGGCPDTDKDGVADIDDKCPAVPGLAKFAGCPDSDSDGVEDALDKCPNTLSGTQVDANGCPIDTDGDGVPNGVDKCPDTPGTATNNGCPEVEEETTKHVDLSSRAIYFETGKAIITRELHGKLDEIVSIMHEYPNYKLWLRGHTDSMEGSATSNMLLSQARVDAVKAYLVSKGVSEARLQAKGFGRTMPIASNRTAIGRAQNRRVEMELYLK